MFDLEHFSNICLVVFDEWRGRFISCWHDTTSLRGDDDCIRVMRCHCMQEDGSIFRWQLAYTIRYIGYAISRPVEWYIVLVYATGYAIRYTIPSHLTDMDCLDEYILLYILFLSLLAHWSGLSWRERWQTNRQNQHSRSCLQTTINMKRRHPLLLLYTDIQWRERHPLWLLKRERERVWHHDFE